MFGSSMVSAGFLFRGNYMARQRAEKVVRSVFCTLPELRPEAWDFVEPLRKRFDVQDVVDALAAPGAISTQPFFLRKARPSFSASVMFQNGPAARPRHNRFDIDLQTRWEGREADLARIVSRALVPEFPDYGYVASAPTRDQQRYDELRRPLSAAEAIAAIVAVAPRAAPPFIVAPPIGQRNSVRLAWFHPSSEFILGPRGFLWDIAWFNFFGRPYVELIGAQRLRAAGWARTEEVGNGIACYATEQIDDPDSFDRRAEIREALSEFVWAPGCNREDKRAPVFDFSEQVAAAPSTSVTLPAGARVINFAGLSEEEKRQAIRAIEKQTGMIYDEGTGMLLPKA